MTEWISLEEATHLVEKSEPYLRKRINQPDSPITGRQVPWGEAFAGRLCSLL